MSALALRQYFHYISISVRRARNFTTFLLFHQMDEQIFLFVFDYHAHDNFHKKFHAAPNARARIIICIFHLAPNVC